VELPLVSCQQRRSPNQGSGLTESLAQGPFHLKALQASQQHTGKSSWTFKV
jgi:hypothetical protein